MSYAVEEETVGAFVVKVLADEDGSSSDPRDWDHGTLMALTHRRYDLPNEAGAPFDDLDGWREVADWLREIYNVAAILPVYMIDHGNVALSTGSYGDPWDSGQVGFILMTREGQDACGTPDDRLNGLLSATVAEYGQYLNGEVYGYVVEDAEGDTVDSCWGFVGESDYALSEGVAAARHHEADRITRWCSVPEWVRLTVLAQGAYVRDEVDA